MADPHTDDLPDSIDGWAEADESNARNYSFVTTATTLHERAADLRAAAAELRRLRDRDAALTRLLDAVAPTDIWWVCANLEERTDDATRKAVACLRRIATAVEGIDQEHER